MYRVVNGKKIEWHNFSRMEESDFLFLQDEYEISDFHLERVRRGEVMSEVEYNSKYIFITLPWLDYSNKYNEVHEVVFSVFIFKDKIISIGDDNSSIISRYFERLSRSTALRRDVLGATSIYFVYRLIDYALRELYVGWRELERQGVNLEKDCIRRDIIDLIGLVPEWQRRLNIFQGMVNQQLDIFNELLEISSIIILKKDEAFIRQMRGEFVILNDKVLAWHDRSLILLDELKMRLDHNFNLGFRRWLSNLAWLILFTFLLFAFMNYDFIIYLGEWFNTLLLLLFVAIALIFYKLIKIR